MINRENMLKVCEVLETTALRQGRGRLAAYPDGRSAYCCLGVMCEVAMDSGIAVDRTVNLTSYVTDETAVKIIRYDDEEILLPGSVQQWLGLPSRNPDVSVAVVEDVIPDYSDFDTAMDDGTEGERTVVRLVDLNDNGVDFKTIAKILRKAYLEETV